MIRRPAPNALSSQARIAGEGEPGEPFIVDGQRPGSERPDSRSRHNGLRSYPGMHVPAHIHLSLWGEGYPLQWVDELRFEGDHYITPAMRSEDANKGPYRTIQRLVRGDDGVLRCSYKIRLQSRSNFK
jgi:hypothetical protein